MNNPYDVHGWSKYRREEALREARIRDLSRPTRSSRDAPPSGTRVNRVWTVVLSLLGRREVVK